MILLFGKGRRSFHKANIEAIHRMEGEAGEDWLIFFQPGDPNGIGIDLHKYEWAYTIGNPYYINSHEITWYKGEPVGWKVGGNPDSIFS